MARDDYDVLDLGDLVLQRGATLRGARLAYTTYGTLDADRSNAVLYPTWYSGRHWDDEWLIGAGMALDPARWFVTVHDNVEAQHRLVTEWFGTERLACVTGWGMGAGQAFQWAVSHPEVVPKILPFCGSARTSEHNRVFLEGVKAALTADDAFRGGWYDQQPTKGLRAAARVCAGWGSSRAFYWQGAYRELGLSSLEDFLVGFWAGSFLDDRDANNLLTVLWTWQHGDVGATPGFHGDLDRALASITARAIVMPAEKDLCFRPEDEAYEVSRVPNAELRVIPGVWGHFAGGGANSRDTAFVDRALGELPAE